MTEADYFEQFVGDVLSPTVEDFQRWEQEYLQSLSERERKAYFLGGWFAPEKPDYSL